MRLFEKVVPQSSSVTSLAFLGETPSNYPPPSRPKGAPSRFSLVAGKEPGGEGSFPVLGYEQVQCAHPGAQRPRLASVAMALTGVGGQGSLKPPRNVPLDKFLKL